MKSRMPKWWYTHGRGMMDHLGFAGSLASNIVIRPLDVESIVTNEQEVLFA